MMGADFGDKLDQDKWTLGFINGVVDLQTGEFRDGRALDYISKSTNIPYLTDDEMNKKDNKEYAKGNSNVYVNVISKQ